MLTKTLFKSHRSTLKLARQDKRSLNVVITGGTKGLGKSLAAEFAKQGDQVHVISRGHEFDLHTHPNIMYFKCDISNPENFQTVLPIVQYSFLLPEVDILINNAGQSGGCRHLEHVSVSKIQNIVDTNLLGSILACKLLYPIMKTQSTGGAIFNLTGAGSDGGGTPNYAVYGATNTNQRRALPVLEKCITINGLKIC